MSVRNLRLRLMSVIFFLLLVCSAVLLVAQAESTHSGQWMIEPCSDKTGTIQLTLRYNEPGELERGDGWGGWGNTRSYTIELPSLSGLTDADLKSPGTHVKFRGVQYAG